MRRDTFLKAAALAALLPSNARAAAAMKMMIPANPGGGWDTTGRALGKAMQDAGVATSCHSTTRAARPARWACRPFSTAPRVTRTR